MEEPGLLFSQVRKALDHAGGVCDKMSKKPLIYIAYDNKAKNYARFVFFTRNKEIDKKALDYFKWVQKHLAPENSIALEPHTYLVGHNELLYRKGDRPWELVSDEEIERFKNQRNAHREFYPYPIPKTS